MAVGDPFLAFTFLVEMDGQIVAKFGEAIAGFSEISGLQAEIEIKDYREGGRNDYVHKLAGPARYPTNLTLKHGLVTSSFLWDWYIAVAGGQVQLANLSIILLDGAKQEVQRWNFKNAYPVKWVGPSLNATTPAVAVETLELVHCGFEVK